MTAIKKHEDLDDEESVAIFIHPDEYKKNPNQAASITVKRIKYIRGKTLAMNPSKRLENLVRVGIAQDSIEDQQGILT